VAFSAHPDSGKALLTRFKEDWLLHGEEHQAHQQEKISRTATVDKERSTPLEILEGRGGPLCSPSLTPEHDDDSERYPAKHFLR
jgi:hypothetical protein